MSELRPPVSASGDGTVTVRVVEALRALDATPDRAPLVLGSKSDVARYEAVHAARQSRFPGRR